MTLIKRLAAWVRGNKLGLAAGVGIAAVLEPAVGDLVGAIVQTATLLQSGGTN